MTVTADRYLLERALGDAIEDRFPVKTNTTVYQGTMLTFVAATGRVTDGAPATTGSIAGACVGFMNNSGSFLGSAITGNTAGTVYALVRWNHEAVFNVKTSARTYTNLNRTVYVYQNDTVSGATGAGTTALRIPAGRLCSFVDSTKAQAYIKLRASGDSAATGA